MTSYAQRHVTRGGTLRAFVLAASLPISIPATRPSLKLASDVDACTLLTTAEASKALEVTSLPGKRLIASSPKICVWSNDSTQGFGGRRVNLSVMTPAAFQVGKSAGARGINIEPVSGLGDEAYYEIPKTDSPFLFVRKGQTAFSVRILNSLKMKAFSREQEKAKEADLAKAAVARL